MIGDLLKIVAVVGGVIYAVLFIGYRSYYSVLGIHPEDVGISQSFILARSVGFIILTIGIAQIFVMAFNALNSASFVRGFLVNFSVGLGAASYARLLLTGIVPTYILVIATVCIIAFAFFLGWLSGLYKNAGYVRLFSLIVLITVLPAVAIDIRATQLGVSSSRGIPVKPFTVYGLPVLDVSSDTATMTWICPMAQRPPIFNGSTDNAIHGTVVGETSTKIFIVYSGPEKYAAQSTDKGSRSHPIISLPQSCVMVSRSFTD